MKRILMIVPALLIAAAPAFAQTHQYGWALSSNLTDPNVNEGAIQAGPFPLYLWYVCSDNGGMAAAEFDLALPAGNSNFGFTAMNGFLNAGGSGNLLLAVGGCPVGPMVAGSWTIFGSAAGSICLVNSAANGIRVTVDCDPVNPQAWPIGAVGYGYGAALTCQDAVCPPPVSTDDQSWGSVKSLYR